MDSGLKYALKYFKGMLIYAVVIFFLIFLIVTYFGGYKQNAFEVYLNGEPMRFFYTEQYSYIFPDVYHMSGNKWVDDTVKYRPNTIDLLDKIELIVNEYEVYNNIGLRKSYDYFMPNATYTYKKLNNQNIKIEIKRMNKTLYNGNFISDLSPYINENGRYYIHIYATRNYKIFQTIKTHISFNVIVGGGKVEK